MELIRRKSNNQNAAWGPKIRVISIIIVPLTHWNSMKKRTFSYVSCCGVVCEGKHLVHVMQPQSKLYRENLKVHAWVNDMWKPHALSIMLRGVKRRDHLAGWTAERVLGERSSNLATLFLENIWQCGYENSLTGDMGNKLSLGASYPVKVRIRADISKSSIYVRQELWVIDDGLRAVPATG